MNVVCISGRLTRKPELRSTATGTMVCNFSLAVDREKNDEVDFIECVCFNKQAENVAKYLDKGSFIETKGRLQIDKYTNNEGKNVSRACVYADQVKFISQPKTIVNEAKNDEKDPYEEMGNKVSNDDELPF